MRKNLILFLTLTVLAAGLGAYVYFYEVKGAADRQAAEDSQKQLFKVSRESVTTLQLENAHGIFRFARAGNEWTLTAPLQTTADTGAVDDLVFALDSLRQGQVVTEKASDLTPFGLATPRYKVTFTTKEGEKGLLVGDEAPFGGQTYVQVKGSSRVLLVNYPLTDKLEKDLAGWRDKKLLDFSVSDVQRLVIQGQGFAGLDASRQNERWIDTSRPTFRLDAGQIEGILYDLQGAKAVGFTGQTDTTIFGLEPATLTVTLEVGKDKTRKELLFGLPYGDEKRLPVVRAKGEEVRLIDASLREKLLKTPDQLRDLRVANLRRYAVQKVTVRLDGQTLTASKDKEAWKLEGSLKDKVKDADVEAVLTDVSDLKAESTLEAPSPDQLAALGLDKPQLELEIAESDPATVTKLAFYRGGGSEVGKVFAKTAEDPLYYRVGTVVLDDLRDVLLKPAAKPGASPAPQAADPSALPAKLFEEPKPAAP